MPYTLLIPEPGTSNARAAKWLGFAADCECHVADNNGDDDVVCLAHIVDHDGQQPDACGHVISPDCGLHAGWTPGDTAEVEAPRWGAFQEGTIPGEFADVAAEAMA